MYLDVYNERNYKHKTVWEKFSLVLRTTELTKRNLGIQYCQQNGLPFDKILKQFNQVHVLTHDFPEMRFIPLLSFKILSSIRCFVKCLSCVLYPDFFNFASRTLLYELDKPRSVSL